MYMILTPGRTGSKLLAKMLESYFNQKHHILINDQNDFYQYSIVHTHFPDKWRYLNSNDTLILSTRKNLIEFISSHWIAFRTDQYFYYHNNKLNTKNLIKKEKIPKDFIFGILYTLKEHYFLYNNVLKERSKNTHLLWYEDWIDDYSILPFYSLLDLSKIELPIKTPIDKSQYIDLEDLKQKILQFRHNTIIENIDDPIFTK